MRTNIINRRRVFDGFFKVDEVTVQYKNPNGGMAEPVARLVFERGDSVAAILFNTDSQRLIFVRQLRVPSCEKGPGWITEIIAGMIDPDESPSDALRREVLEETGHSVCNIQAVGTFYLSPGGSSERIFLYYAEVNNATRLGEGGGLRSEGEDIRLVEMSVSQAFADVFLGGFPDAKTIIGILSLKEHLLHHEDR